VEPPTVQQVQAACAEMRRLRAEGEIQDLPLICAPGNRQGPRPAPAGKKSLGI
jgi:hypothetical protein